MRLVVVVNENARRGGPRVAARLERELPRADVVLTRDGADVERVAKALAASPPDLVLSAGGDGTAISLLDALRRSAPGRGARPLLRFAMLKLGTGNGLGNATHTPSLARAVELLRRADRGGAELPFERLDLVEVEGRVAHFAGTGWDAELIHDFHAQRGEASVLPAVVRGGLGGYLNALLSRTVPRNLRLARVEVEVENAGAAAMGVDAGGRPFTLEGSEGQSLYRGPVSVCAAGTSPEWGFRFRALPFARLVPGRFNLRMYVGTTTQALSVVPQLWSGKHPLPGMLTWLLTAARLRFSRRVPFQIGGDLLGERDAIRYGLAAEHALVLDWRALEAQVTRRPVALIASDLLAAARRA